MPILACIALSVMIYILLMYSINNNNSWKASKNTMQHQTNISDTLAGGNITDEKCPKCHKDFHGNWRCCPYCGYTRGKR